MCLQSSGKLEMERGMVKPMIRGEQQDSRSDPRHPPLPTSSVFIQHPSGLVPLLTALFRPNRSQDSSADRAELTLPAGIEFRDNCEY